MLVSKDMKNVSRDTLYVDTPLKTPFLLTSVLLLDKSLFVEQNVYGEIVATFDFIKQFQVHSRTFSINIHNFFFIKFRIKSQNP